MWDGRRELALLTETLHESVRQLLEQTRSQLALQQRLLHAYNPQEALARGYALVRKKGQLLRGGADVSKDDYLTVELRDAQLDVSVKRVIMKEEK